VRNKYTAEQREKLVEVVRSTGARVSDVAKRMGVAPSAAYVWLKRSKPAAPAPSVPVFARLMPAPSAMTSRLVLELGAVKVHVDADFDPLLLRQVVAALSSAISQGLPIYVALEPVDMRMGYERLGGIVREQMQAEPRSKALFVFVGKRGQTMKVLTWDGTGAVVVHKRLDAGKFELPKPTRVGDQHVIVSDAIFEVIYKGIASGPKKPRKRIH